MAIKIGINGMGRIGRLLFRIACEDPEFEIVQVNDPSGSPNTLAHLIYYDSVHGRWQHNIDAVGQDLVVLNNRIPCFANKDLSAIDWSGCDLVFEATGRIKSSSQAQAFFDAGVERLLVTAPVNEDGVLNVVMGVNHHDFVAERDRLITAASCTTNCLAPVVKVIHEKLGIIHGSMTTIHAVTNSQALLDSPMNDLRCARACELSLIPSTTGSAKAITRIFPDLKGRLNGHAVRVPLANASLTDCIFEVKTACTAEQVNALLKEASEGELRGILGFEEKPLVSVDYCGDPRSSIIDALSTLVIDDTHIKIYAWYDNEWGYANRAIDLALWTKGKVRAGMQL